MDVNWEVGIVSGSNGQGIGGNFVCIGYLNGGVIFYEFLGLGMFLFFFDFNLINGLIYNQFGVVFDGMLIDGWYVFSVCNGGVIVQFFVGGDIVVFELFIYGFLGVFFFGVFVVYCC